MRCIKKLVYLALLLGLALGVKACGWHSPLTAEEYNPEKYADHRVDLTSSETIRDLYQVMKDTHEILSKCGVPYWGEGGTALGAVRNQGIIPWDDDNDIAIQSTDVGQFLLLRPIFKNLGYFIEKVFFGYRIVKEGAASPSDVDVFVMKEMNGKFYYEHGDWGSRNIVDPISGESKAEKVFIKREELFPLREVQFGPIRVMVSNQPRPYLDAMFRGWNTVAFTYGHAGQRKFKINLEKYPQFKLPAPLNSETFQSIDLRGEMKDRVSSELRCPRLQEGIRIPFRPFFDGV